MWWIISIVLVLLLMEIVRDFITVEPFILWSTQQKAPFRKNMQFARNRLMYRIVLVICFVAISGFLMFAFYNILGGN